MKTVQRAVPAATIAFGGAFLIMAVALRHGTKPTLLDRAFNNIVRPTYRHSAVAGLLFQLGSAEVLALVAVGAALLCWRRSDRRAAVFAVVAAIVAPTLAEVVAKPLVSRFKDSTSTFPSGHITGVTSSVILCLVLVYRFWGADALRKFGVVGAVIVAITTIAAVHNGNHWFTDTLGGMALGASVTLGLSLLFFPEGISPDDPANPPGRRWPWDRGEDGDRLR